MKKILFVLISIFCLFGCGRSDTEKAEEGALSIERPYTKTNQGKELGFIKNEQGYIVHMKNIKSVMKRLSVSINREDWKAVQRDTRELKEASPVAFTGANKKELPVEFVNLDVRFHLSALELIGACEAQDKDKATAAFFKVVNSCDECHVKYNPKETSTSWFQ